MSLTGKEILELLQNIYTSPHDLLKKVQREKAVLLHALGSYDQPRSTDLLFNFAVGCYHLVDWVKAFRPDLKDDVYTLLNNNMYLSACRDIANASKHVTLNLTQGAYKFYPPVLSSVETSATDHGVYKSALSNQDTVPPIRVKVQFQKGAKITVQEVVTKAVKAWEDFFRAKAL